MKSIGRWCALLSLLLGLLAGVAAMAMAWDHNPQCAIHCAESGIDWGHWLTIGVFWLLAGFVLSLLLSWPVAIVVRSLWRAMQENQKP